MEVVEKGIQTRVQVFEPADPEIGGRFFGKGRPPKARRQKHYIEK
ncbi:MAG: hypothetical protein QF674_02350 [Candidatus Marinimicrobia bacterium]|jgi:hypothetical protein|nr:hypothetical protein [Candidatus Neomarinimicrobiota bacterium]MDP7528826.1 hypothetical protein [Candidatus Neomarinimicrobiota bacterium]MDP7715550.1 hypothetical protein [Candidatus Neomarinimicrobiota bacterium]|tara:strand:+ start:411 stop:545 length:135 start_codon:yes stop_codon:yes gene_type:complete